MMKKIVFVFALVAVLISCKTETKKTEATEEKATEQVVVETPEIAVGDFDTKAGDFIDKELKVTGIVDHVCKHGGKKLLVVDDNGDAHIVSDVRFDEALKGSEVTITGIVKEERIDEAYLLKLEEDNIKSHSEGKSNKEQYENKMKHIAEYRAKMAKDSIDYISNFSLKYVSHKEKEVK